MYDNKIAFGGGCHWCTEAVFQSLKGVETVTQGYVASGDENTTFSEAVIVYFDPEKIELQTLIEIHLHTHQSTSNHSMRTKYRSAVYIFSKAQEKETKGIIKKLQKVFGNTLITKVLAFSAFKISKEVFQNYYQKDPNKPFCKTFINPKLKFLIEHFSKHLNEDKVSHLNLTTP